MFTEFNIIEVLLWGMANEGSYNKCQACRKCLGFSLMKREGASISETVNSLTKYTEDECRGVYIET